MNMQNLNPALHFRLSRSNNIPCSSVVGVDLCMLYAERICVPADILRRGNGKTRTQYILLEWGARGMLVRRLWKKGSLKIWDWIHISVQSRYVEQ